MQKLPLDITRLLNPVIAALIAAVTGFSALPALAESPLEKLSLDAILSKLGADNLPEGIVKSNGRIEGQAIEIATKYPGRVAEVLVSEGDIVEAGGLIARIDDREYRAQLLGAEADVLRAEAALDIAKAQRDQALSAAELARSGFQRIDKLFSGGYASTVKHDEARNRLNSAEAELRGAEAQIANAISTIAAASAQVSQLNAVLDEMVLVAPRRGRVQYQLVQAGEVVGGGARIVTLIDLTDISMSLYLAAIDIARLSVGDEARIVLDAVPDYVVPARISFISADAQFTPKMVETQDEREQLVFRIKIQIPRELLQRFESQVKAGIRGVGFVRTDPGIDWPSELAVKLPE